MKEEKTKSKRKLIYYFVLAASVLLLAAATVLTVYFVTQGDRNVLEEKPPVVEPDDPDQPDDPDKPDEPDKPSTGDEVRFIAPVENAACKTEYNAVYVNETLRWAYYHKALDYEAAAGDTVRAVSDGTVELVSCDEHTGNLVVINHGGELRSYYRFVEPEEGLRAGDTVKQGQKIGTVAEAYGIERFDGVHLHFEMKEGKTPVNPLKYIDAVLEEK